MIGSKVTAPSSMSAAAIRRAPRAAAAAPRPSAFRFYSIASGAAPGCWYTIHLLAANGERDALFAVLRVFADRFMCPKCRPHIKRHVAANPLPTGARALFDWSVAFHNAVAARTAGERAEIARTLTADGADELFRQLTSAADDDGREYESTGDCDGCTPSRPAAAAAAGERYVSAIAPSPA
jgi:hypothetical protein